MTTTTAAHEAVGNADATGLIERPRRRHRLRLWLVSLAVAGVIGWLIVEGIGNALQYYRPVDQALGDRAQLGTTDFQIEGNVVAGSVRSVPGGVDFTIAAGGASVAVNNQGNPPQLFEAGTPVVLAGHLNAAGNLFLSSQILVKHSASYVAATPTSAAPAVGTKG